VKGEDDGTFSFEERQRQIERKKHSIKEILGTRIILILNIILHLRVIL